MSDLHHHILEILKMNPQIGAGSVAMKLRDRRVHKTVPQVQSAIEQMIAGGILGFQTLDRHREKPHNVYFALQRTPRQVRSDINRVSTEIDQLSRALGRKEKLMETFLAEMDTIENQAAWVDRVLANQTSADMPEARTNTVGVAA